MTVVINIKSQDFADCDHVVAAEAIAKGAAVHSSDKPLYWIHTSGTGILCWESAEKQNYGEVLEKVYNDWDGVSELTSLPDKAMHRNVDKIVLATSATNPGAVKTAIVCPPTIYGRGRGPVNQRSMQLPAACQAVLKRGEGFVVGAGKNIWTQSHIEDLSEIYLFLGEAALSGGGKASWGEEGYYLTDNGPFAWGDVFREIAKVAYKKGFVASDSAESIPLSEVDEIHPRLKYMVGANSRGMAIRAKKVLGWEPKQPLLIDTIPHALDIEAKSLGLVQSHAEKVS